MAYKRNYRGVLTCPKWVLSFMAKVVQQLFCSKSYYDSMTKLTVESIAQSDTEWNTFYSRGSGGPYQLFQGCLLTSFSRRSTAGSMELGGFLWVGGHEGVGKFYKVAAVADKKFSNRHRKKHYWGWSLSLSMEHSANLYVIAIFWARGKNQA